MKTKVIALFFLIGFTLLAVTSAARKSATCDETAHHIPSGYIFLTKHDLRFDTCAPPLARYIAAFPMLFMDINLPDSRDFWRREDRADFSRAFFQLNIDKYKSILFYSRIMIVAVSIFGAVILYLWAKQLYSKRAGIIALLLYCFSPNIIAHAKLSTTDLVTTVFILLSAYMFWQFLQYPGHGKAVLAGVSLGLALLSKYSALLIIPVYVLFFFTIIPKKTRLKKSLVLFLSIISLAFFTLWAGYGFEVSPLLADTLRHQEKYIILKDFCIKVFPFCNEAFIHNLLYSLPLPLSSYILGVLGVIRHGAEGHNFFFLGNYYTHGLLHYYIIAFLIKTPIPMIAAFLAGILLAIRNKLAYKEWYIFSFIAVFFLAASFSKLQLGLRYILPIYPFCFIISARFFASALAKNILLKVFAISLLLWYSITSFFTWPDYLSYFNELIGGPENGYKYLRDSNLDWGQDLPALKNYMSENGMDRINLLYYGQGIPEVYGIVYDNISAGEKKLPKKNIYAVSVTSLEAVKWTRQYVPSAKAGYSIFIYDLR